LSKFQKRVRELLEEVLGKVSIKAEVNVAKLFPEYEARNQHYDLVIPSYNLIIECHGEQHRTIQQFGKSRQEENPMAKLISQKRRDRRKEQIALDNDWSYVIIWHNELPSSDERATKIITDRINQAFNSQDN
jgi:G:T-mismatch repair DNA endonuclease (very short patch repair protein)